MGFCNMCIWVVQLVTFVTILRFIGSFSPSRKERKRDLRSDAAWWTPGFFEGAVLFPQPLTWMDKVIVGYVNAICQWEKQKPPCQSQGAHSNKTKCQDSKS